MLPFFTDAMSFVPVAITDDEGTVGVAVGVGVAGASSVAAAAAAAAAAAVPVDFESDNGTGEPGFVGVVDTTVAVASDSDDDDEAVFDATPEAAVGDGGATDVVMVGFAALGPEKTRDARAAAVRE